jgi:hypothetical protein
MFPRRPQARFSLPARRCRSDAEELGLHLTVAAAAEFGTGGFIPSRRWRGEFDCHRITRLGEVHLDMHGWR